MADGFEALIDRANAFYAELAQNNRKDWFEPRKETYRDEILKPAELFGELLAEDLSRLTGKSHSAKVFRIYRDVRFSKDKTPYNAHLHLLWKQTGGAETAPAWFLGSAPDYLTMGMGVMGLSGDALARFRAFVDADGATLTQALDDAHSKAGVALSDWGPPPLKRVPKPYPQEHPQAELLKRKNFVVSAPFADDWRKAGLVKATLTNAQTLMPLWSMLGSAFDG